MALWPFGLLGIFLLLGDSDVDLGQCVKACISAWSSWVGCPHPIPPGTRRHQDRAWSVGVEMVQLFAGQSL